MRTFTNPVIPGFYPDPSICRDGDDFYLVTSSFEYFPGVPVFHSRDLVYWRQVGHCLTRPSQLPLEGAAFSAGIYAPTIRCHQGRFYMITTNVSCGKHLIVSTDNPAGDWSEPLWVEAGGIDPSLTFDSDGKVYFNCNGNGGIFQFEIDIETGDLLTERKLIWAGTGGQHPEAPHLYHIGDWYYLLIAEGGTEYGHMITIARSRQPYGPFESCPRNPIASHRSLSSPFQATGHGDLIQDALGDWWMVCLAIRPSGYPTFHHLGRETYLAPVKWDASGWPVVGDAGKIPTLGHAPRMAPAPVPQSAPRDNFDVVRPGLVWNFLRNPADEDWSLTARDGYLRLIGNEATLDDEASPAWMGRRQQHFDCTATTLLDFQPRQSGEEAGLTAYMNPGHHYEIGLRLDAEGIRTVFVRRRVGSLQVTVAETTSPDGPLHLRVSSDTKTYRFEFSSTGRGWIELATGETRYVSTEVAGGFTGIYLAMYATGNGQKSTAPADFDWFEYMVG